VNESPKFTRRETLIAGAALTVMLPSAASAAGAMDSRSDADVRLRVNGAMERYPTR
jgi:hypothetical protein